LALGHLVPITTNPLERLLADAGFWNALNTTGPYSGPQTLNLVFYAPGRYTLGLMGINNNSSPALPAWSMFEMDVMAV